MLPTRVRDDDLVGHRLQAVVDDHHLQRLVGRQVPQGSCRARVTVRGEEEEEGEEHEEVQEEDYEENKRGNKKVKDEEEPSGGRAKIFSQKEIFRKV